MTTDLVSMTIYLYDHATQAYIGELKTKWIKNGVPAGTLIMFDKIKYIVVDIERQGDTNSYSVTVNRT